MLTAEARSRFCAYHEIAGGMSPIVEDFGRPIKLHRLSIDAEVAVRLQTESEARPQARRSSNDCMAGDRALYLVHYRHEVTSLHSLPGCPLDRLRRTIHTRAAGDGITHSKHEMGGCRSLRRIERSCAPYAASRCVPWLGMHALCRSDRAAIWDSAWSTCLTTPTLCLPTAPAGYSSSMPPSATLRM